MLFRYFTDQEQHSKLLLVSGCNQNSKLQSYAKQALVHEHAQAVLSSRTELCWPPLASSGLLLAEVEGKLMFLSCRKNLCLTEQEKEPNLTLLPGSYFLHENKRVVRFHLLMLQPPSCDREEPMPGRELG